MTTVDVIIVGAGLAGLSAAYNLHKKDSSLNVIVLEAKDRVGGRLYTTDIKCATGTAKWDLGGQWVGQTQPHILALLKEFNIDIYSQYTDGSKIMQVGKDGEVSKYSGWLPALPWGGLYHLARAIYTTENMSKLVNAEDPYSCEQAEEWDSMTLDSMCRKITSNEGVGEVMNAAVRITFGCESKQLSALYYLMYGRAAGGYDPLYQTTDGSGQQFKIQGGAQQVVEMLRDKVGADKVILNSPVVSIDQTGDMVSVVTKDQKVYTGRRVIMAIPPQYAARMEYSPPLPADRLTFLNHMPMAHLSKFIVTYKESFWRSAGYSGEVVSNGVWSERSARETGAATGPVGIVFDATDHLGNPALVGFYSGRQGIAWNDCTRDKRVDALLRHLSECFGDQALEPIEVAEKLWVEEPYTGGCPISCPPPGYMQYFNTALREPLDKLHWCGTESATVWCGFMNGAVQSGERASCEVLHVLSHSPLTAQDYRSTYYGMSERNAAARTAAQARARGRHRRRVGTATTVTALALALAAACTVAYIRHRH